MAQVPHPAPWPRHLSPAREESSMSRAGQTLRRALAAALACAILGGQHGIQEAGPRTMAQAGTLTLIPSAGPPGSLITLTAPPGSLPAKAVAVVNIQDATAAYAGTLIGQGQ